MTTRGGSSAIRRLGAIAAIAWTGLLACSGEPAVAQGLFESLFGAPRYARPEPPPQSNSYADPNPFERESRRPPADSGYIGQGTVFCVRTCDGRYFPLQRHAGATPAEMCQAFCPAAQTMVFSGSSIDHAVAANGTRYADLDNAFDYRDRVVENCTCNGRDGFGLARLSPVTDPTLRPGDIVATNNGLVDFRGRSTKAAEFTPINRLSGAWGQWLSNIKIRPTPAQQFEVAPAPDKKDVERPATADRRRVQNAR